MFKKIRNKVNSAVAAVRATVACKKAALRAFPDSILVVFYNF